MYNPVSTLHWGPYSSLWWAAGSQGQRGCSVAACRDEDFQAVLREREEQDRAGVEAKLRRPLTADERCHLGVSNVRRFLETELLRRYCEQIQPISRYIDSQTRMLVSVSCPRQ